MEEDNENKVRLISSEETDYGSKKKPLLSSFFRKMLVSERNTVDPYDPSVDMTRQDIEEYIGTSWEVIKKRLNGSKPIERDFVIALCFAFRLSAIDANRALSIAGFPLLCKDDKSLIEQRLGYKDQAECSENGRDAEIIESLNNNMQKRKTLFQINTELCAKGMKILNIMGKSKSTYNDPKIKVLKKKIEIEKSFAKYNPYDSLMSEYDIDLYHICISLLLEENGKKMEINLSSDGTGYIYDDINLQKGSIIDFSSLSTNNKFYGFFDELNSLINREKKKIFIQLDDTKNYRSRVSAKFINKKLHVFGETFVFSIPENNNYLFIDYYDKKYNIILSHRSLFMYQKIGENEYSKYQKNFKPDRKKIAEFRSLSEFKYEKKSINSPDYYSYQELKHLVEDIEELKENLKEKKEFILNPDIFWGPNSEKEMCDYLGVTDKFGFYIDNSLYEDEEEIYIPKTKTIYDDINGTTVKITIADIENGCSFGLNYEEIKEILASYQSIDLWIKSI